MEKEESDFELIIKSLNFSEEGFCKNSILSNLIKFDNKLLEDKIFDVSNF